MGLISFIREAGEKLFGRNEAQGTSATPAGSDARNATATGAPAGTTTTGPAGAEADQTIAAGAQAGRATAATGAAAAHDDAAAKAIERYIASMNLSAKGLKVGYDSATATATVSGEAPDQATREKIVLCCGNVEGVEKVNDRMTVARSEPEGRFHTVVKGDTLSKIAREYYGNANAYMRIFEANKPMLSDPDKIYPGQVLRIPPQQ